MQKLIIRYNALISELVNRKQTQHNRKITKVHTTSVQQTNNDNGFFPTAAGYSRIAYDFLEKIAEAFSKGWVTQDLDPAGKRATLVKTSFRTVAKFETTSTST